MACQLSLLLYQRKHGFLSQAEYEATLEYFESMWAANSSLDEAMMADGGTRFVLRDKRTGVILESFLFRRCR